MIALLASYSWPGNIRELENVAKKIVAVGDAQVALDDLRAAPQRLPQVSDVPRVFFAQGGRPRCVTEYGA